MRLTIHEPLSPAALTAVGIALSAALVLLGTTGGWAQPAPGRERVIVVLEDDAGPPAEVAAALARRANGRIGFVYEHALKGFSMQVPAAAIPGLRNHPAVRYVESDDPVQLFVQQVPTGLDRIHQPDTTDGAFPALTIDGIDDLRIDVDVAVIDTGIDHHHPDLNVVGGANCTYLEGGGPPWARSAVCADGIAEADDDHYHGTHVAGTIGALDDDAGMVGVAPGARLWAVKVLSSSGSGYESNIVAGIDWVVTHADQIEVANMSLGGAGYSQAEQDAISTAVDAGVVFVVAAGNDGSDALNYSPAGLEDVVTVSALADFDGRSGGGGSPTCRTDRDDTLADFSNWGEAVEMVAPGVCIFSTYPLEQGGYGTISGTSMASPHVAGAAALLASGGSSPLGRSEVEALVDQLIATGNLDWIDDSGDGVQEPLLDLSGFQPPATVPGLAGDGGDLINQPPAASFTSVCTGLECAFFDQSTDDDGTIAAWAWDFGDGTGSAERNPTHTYNAGTFEVTLAVTDDGGAMASTSDSVTLTGPVGAGINLSVSGYKVKGFQKADLTWSGASSSNVDVFRDGFLRATSENDGAYTDHIDRKGGGSYSYQLCEAGTTTCSAEVTVAF